MMMTLGLALTPMLFALFPLKVLLCVLPVLALLWFCFDRMCCVPGSAPSIRLASYDISTSHGLMPEHCLHRLPEAFEPWESVVDILPQLNMTRKLHDRVHSLPELSVPDDLSLDQLRRAYLVLGMMVHSYVHGASVPWETPPVHPRCSAGLPAVPRQLAVPWHQVCTQLGLPCVFTAAALETWNWKITGDKTVQQLASHPVELLDRLTCISTMTDLRSEIQFHMMPCAMHVLTAPSLPSLCRLPEMLRHAAAPEAVEQISELLEELTELFVSFRKLFKHVFDRVDVQEFYDMYRPLLAGFWPDGVLLEGVGGGEGTVVKAKGPSGGQLPFAMLIDRGLGVDHGRSSSGEFQLDMLQYMPRNHRELAKEFIRQLDSGAYRSVKQLIDQECEMENVAALKPVYNECVQQLVKFRGFHLTVATKYLGGKTEKGTGTSTFRDLLQETIDNTVKAQVGGLSRTRSCLA